MQEGSLGAPFRHPIDWKNPDYQDVAKLDVEMRRVFDICHGCRRCFNLCDSFPRLFTLIDQTPGETLDEVPSGRFTEVVEACTLCDMCFMTKCPYVPPHPFQLDFPQLMLRHRATHGANTGHWVMQQLTQTDRNGRLFRWIAPVVNWLSQMRGVRRLLAWVTGIHADVKLPSFQSRSLTQQLKQHAYPVNRQAPGLGRKVALYATCFGEYNNPQIGKAAQAVLAHNGVTVELVYSRCCGMPKLEQGKIREVVDRAKPIIADLVSWIDRGYEIVTLVPSCTFMLREQWPLLFPKDTQAARLAQHTHDISGYVAQLAQEEGLVEGLQPLPEGVTVQLACHARAQNRGNQAVEMLKAIPDMPLHIVERCSGHGGTFGLLHFETAKKIGAPAAREMASHRPAALASECPLAAKHLAQLVRETTSQPVDSFHPIELLAKSYGLMENL